MKKEGHSLNRFYWILGLAILLAGSLGFSIGAQKTIPVDLFRNYPMNFLASEVGIMNECAECHTAEDYHTCQSCHDDHGAIEMESIPFYAMVELAGDVPDPDYISLNEILPYHERPNTHITLLTFLEQQGVTDFEHVTLTSNDGGFVTIEKTQLTDQALLMPYEDGIRFAAEDLHVSSWLKGIRQIIVVGTARPLIINGQATSIGRLLNGSTILVTIEQTEVMLKSEHDGKVRQAMTASRIEGIALEDLLPERTAGAVIIIDEQGEEHRLENESAQGAVLAVVYDELTLVLPKRGRSQWIPGVIMITAEE